MKRQSLLLFGWLFLATPVAVQAQFIYTNNNGGITITGYAGTNNVVVIPDTIIGLPVTDIGVQAFYLDKSLTSVTIPNSVTNIGNDAFDYCTSLTSVTIGSGVTSIGDAAFYMNTSLTSVTIPNSVTSIGNYAFAFCTSLTSVTIGSGVTSIGGRAFNFCYSLTAISVETNNPAYSSVDGVLFNHNQTTLVEFPQGKVIERYMIPNTVTSIGDYAFFGCSLTSVTIPDSVTNIEAAPFLDCPWLTNIMVDPLNSAFISVDGVLFNQSQTTLVKFPQGKVIERYMIPNTVTSIGDAAFYMNTSLTSVTIPNSVTNIGGGAFDSCSSLTNLTIPDSVISIAGGAFLECISLTSVTIGNRVTSIGDYAFKGDTSLTNVTIPNSVTSIGMEAFFSCGLTSIMIPNSVTSIGDYAFFRCSLTSISIPNSVTNIGNDAFAGCFSLTGVYFQGNAPSLGAFVFGGDFLLFPLDNATAYYLPGTTGWSTNFGGIPTALWSLPYPLVLNSSLGVRSNQFGFTVSWATNLNVVVEATSDLANPIWSPVQTNALNGGTFYFNDLRWTNYPKRFYRVRSQ